MLNLLNRCSLPPREKWLPRHHYIYYICTGLACIAAGVFVVAAICLGQQIPCDRSEMRVLLGISFAVVGLTFAICIRPSLEKPKIGGGTGASH